MLFKKEPFDAKVKSDVDVAAVYSNLTLKRKA